MEDDQKYLPMMAGFSRKDFFTNENIRLWEYFHALPEKVQDILKSREIARYIFAIEQKYHLNDAQTEELSRSVRRYFFREVSEDAFVQHIAQVCGIPPQEGLRMLREMVNITPAPPQRDEEESDAPQQPQRHLVSLPLEQALRQYPAIKDQVVTGVQIFMRSLPQPLKPSVKNWIMVYERVLGASKHTAIERGEFVFRAEPTRGLSQDDRQKLAIIFKSRDEGVPLTIDRDQRMIVFDVQPQVTEEDEQYAIEQQEEDVRNVMQNREGVVRRNESFVTDTAHYTIRNAVQSVRSSGGFVPQKRSMSTQKPPRQAPQLQQQSQMQQIQKPVEAQPTWGQTPMMRPQGGVPSTSSTHRSPQGLLESQKRPSQTQSMPKKVTQSNTIGIGTQKQQRVAAPQHKSVEAPRTIGLQSGYGTMTPVVQSPDNLPAVQASSVHGVISFSSNHNLPIERKKHHTLQSTKKYLSPRAEN